MTTFSLTSFSRGQSAERRSSRVCPKKSTFLPNDRSQCLGCVLSVIQCVFGAHLDPG